MAYVIAEPCIGTKDTACVDACPVDCIHPKKDETGYADSEMLYIDPVECIDCGACVPVCPVSAIFALDDLPEKWKEVYQSPAGISSSNVILSPDEAMLYIINTQGDTVSAVFFDKATGQVSPGCRSRRLSGISQNWS